MTPAPRPELPGTAQALLDAVLAISSDLDQRNVLTRIVEAASRLTGAQYAALGVIGHHGSLVEFVTTGLSAAQHTEIGALPRERASSASSSGTRTPSGWPCWPTTRSRSASPGATRR